MGKCDGMKKKKRKREKKKKTNTNTHHRMALCIAHMFIGSIFTFVAHDILLDAFNSTATVVISKSTSTSKHMWVYIEIQLSRNQNDPFFVKSIHENAVHESHTDTHKHTYARLNKVVVFLFRHFLFHMKIQFNKLWSVSFFICFQNAKAIRPSSTKHEQKKEFPTHHLPCPLRY